MKKLVIYVLTTLFVICITVFCPNITKANDIYTDNETGISFELPSGWSAIGLADEDREIAKERFSTGEDFTLFVYGSSSLYEQLPNDLKDSYDKSEIISFRYSDSDVKEMLEENGSFSSYRKENIGGVTWYVFENDIMDYYMQFINGNLIFFNVITKMSSNRYEEVKEIIQEVSKTELEKEKASLNKLRNTNNSSSTNLINSSPDYNTLDNENSLLTVWIVIFIIALIIYGTYRSKRKNKEKEISCKECGMINEPGSKYCSNCGKEL